MRLAINIATRGRPERVVDTVNRMLANIAEPNTVLMVSHDDDDAPLPSVLWSPKVCLIDSRPREDSLGAKYNRLEDIEADVYMPMSDYTPHVTPGFDTKILEAAALFPDGIGLVVNHHANGSFYGAYGITALMAEGMGSIYPEHFPYWFVDHWVQDVAQMIGRIAVADVHIDARNKPPTQEMREPAFWATAYDAMRVLRREQAERLFPMMDEPGWRKDMLRSNWGNIEFRSQAINDHVRQMTGGYDMIDGGERYRRLKSKALATMRECYARLQPELERVA